MGKNKAGWFPVPVEDGDIRGESPPCSLEANAHFNLSFPVGPVLLKNTAILIPCPVVMETRKWSPHPFKCRYSLTESGSVVPGLPC